MRSVRERRAHGRRAKRTPRRSLAAGAALLCALLCARGASADVLPLAELERRALARHAQADEGALRVRAAAAEVRQAESARRPKVGLSVDVTAQPGRALFNLGEALGNESEVGRDIYVQGVPDPGRNLGQAVLPRPRAGAGVQLDANLYDFGRTAAAVQAGTARRRAAEAGAELSRDEVIAEVRASYLAWLSAHQLHALAAHATSDAERRSERVNALIQEGVRPRTDRAPVDADRMLGDLERERAEGELAAARLALEYAVGEALPDAVEPDLELLARPFPAAPSGGVHPSLRVLGQQRAALEATARLHRKQRLPLLSTSVGAGYYGQLTQSATRDDPRYGFTWFPTYSLGLALTIPLWDGGNAQAAAEAAEANAAELRLRVESLERARQQAFERARTAAESAERRRAIAEQLLEVCKVRVADTEAGYELGAMPFEQVQQARALLRRAETELVLAQVARAEAVLRASDP